MAYPSFFDAAPAITLRDPLADFLGAADDGVVEYHYVDAVRLAGHSCPTVAGSYLMARAALKALYPDHVPERGAISVRVPGAESEGVNGVMAQVFTLITGAAADNGFHGIGGRYARHSLLAYAEPTRTGDIQFSRRDNGRLVGVSLDLSSVPPAPNLRELLMAAFDAESGSPQRRAFADAWQGRVRKLLLEHADDASVVHVTALN